MKLNKLFFAIIASVLVFAGCEKEAVTSFDNIKLSQTYLSIPENGGSAVITITATEAWSFVQDDMASWLTVDKLSGEAGETTVTFTADAVSGGRESALKISAGSRTQFVTVRQGSLTPVQATCKEIIDGPDGKTYRVKGTVTGIANTTYGNWYLTDNTGEVYIYGTLDKKGAEKNFLSLGIEVGDVVTVEGPKTTYGTTIELVNVTVISITKSLIAVVTPEQEFPKEGGEFEVRVAYKGTGLYPSVPEDYRSWVSVAEVKNIPGVATKIETNPADTAVITLAIAANAGGDREGSISFSTMSGNSSSAKPYNFAQKGAIIDATVAQFLDAAEDLTQYRVTGVIKAIKVSAQYHNADITIVGGLGEEVLLYRTVTKEGNIEDLDLHVGDMITVVGKRSSYKGTPQMAAGGVYESHICYTAATVAEFLAAEESSTLYAVTGVIEKVADLSTQYNNVGITIKDGDNSVLCYRATTFDKSGVDKLDLTVGNTITIAGKRSSYKGAAQMAAGGIVLLIEPIAE